MCIRDSNYLLNTKILDSLLDEKFKKISLFFPLPNPRILINPLNNIDNFPRLRIIKHPKQTAIM